MIRRILFLLTMCLTFPLALSAQVGEARNELALGFNGGICMNTISFDPTIRQSQHTAPTLGATFRYTCEKYFKTLCAIQIELNYAALGWKEKIMSSTEAALPDTYERTMSYVQLPLLARLSWGSEKRGLMGFIIAGPQVGYCFAESSKQSSTWTLNSEGNPDRPNGVFQQYAMSIQHRFDYGIAAGAGLELNTAIGHFNLEGRYYYGLSDIYKNSKKDVFSRSNNGTIIVKATYLVNLISNK